MSQLKVSHQLRLAEAESWGHEAIAFIDTYGVQAYPEICLS